VDYAYDEVAPVGAEGDAIALFLRNLVVQVTPDEFRREEVHYGRHSQLGRELLFLIANNDWMLATTESVEITSSMAVETKIKVDIDFDRVKHEAVRRQTGRLWLPVVVLPPLRRRSQVTVTVTDARGGPLVTLPSTDLHHRISAAISEMIINMFVVQGPDMLVELGWTPEHDQKLLLSAAIYRLLQRHDAAYSSLQEAAPPAESAEIHRARRWVLPLLDALAAVLSPAHLDAIPRRGWPVMPELPHRVTTVLRALAESEVVVVALERVQTPTVVTVTLPSRPLHLRPGPAKRHQRHISPPRLRAWHWAVPRVDVDVDLLLPSSEAARQVEVSLPDGLSLDQSRPLSTCAELDIQMGAPPPLRHLQQLMNQLLHPPRSRPISSYQCLADLAGAKADAVQELLRYYEVGHAAGTRERNVGYETTDEALSYSSLRARLAQLRSELGHLSAEGSAETLAGLASIWGGGEWLLPPLRRRTSAQVFSGRPAVVLSTSMIEDESERADPMRAKIHLGIAVTGSRALRRGGRPTVGSKRRARLTLCTGCLDHAASAVLQSTWWRNTTETSLTLSQPAYGYLVWQRGESSTLRDLLIDAQPTSARAHRQLPTVLDRPVGDRWTRWLSGLAAEASSRPAAQKRTASAEARFVSMQDNPASSREREPATVLGLLRAATASQSLTFAVFRDPPKAELDHSGDEVIRVDVDTDRAALSYVSAGVIGVFLGLAQAGGLLPVSGHPVAAVLKAAEKHGLAVLDVQLPIGAPAFAYDDLQWARVQLGLRDAGMSRVSEFLSDLHAFTDAFAVHQRPPLGTPHLHRLVTAVQTVREGIPRILNYQPSASNTGPEWESRLVLASDLDVVAASGAHQNEAATAKTWRVMAISAHQQPGIESKILNNIDPNLRLAGLKSATVHGETVLLLLGHNSDGPKGSMEPPGWTRKFGSARDIAVHIDKWQSREELGTAQHHPLLRVHMRTPNRPGAVLGLLDSLDHVLHENAPAAMTQRYRIFPYAKTETGAANTAFISIVFELPVTPPKLSHWGSAELDAIERSLRALLARGADAAATTPTEDLVGRDNVIRVSLAAGP